MAARVGSLELSGVDALPAAVGGPAQRAQVQLAAYGSLNFYWALVYGFYLSCHDRDL